MTSKVKNATVIQVSQAMTALSQAALVTAIMLVTAINLFAIVKTVILVLAASSFLALTAALIKAFVIKECATANQALAALIARERLVRITALKTACALKIQSAYASQASKD